MHLDAETVHRQAATSGTAARRPLPSPRSTRPFPSGSRRAGPAGPTARPWPRRSWSDISATTADGELARGRSYVDVDPDRVALQDALAQIVALQFMTAGLDEVVVPTTVHCDHLIRARTDAAADLRARARSPTPRSTTSSARCSARYGIGFWEPGSGIIHQVVLENYAFPGGMMIGTDSHTPNAGGLGMFAVGVGGGDAIDVMTGSPFNVRWPRLIGVHLTGSLSGWTSAKDVILRVAEPPHHRAAARVPSSSTSGPAPTPSAPPGRPRSATWAPSSGRPPRCSPSTPPSPPT